ncbi:amidohydrolase [Neptunomonas japonica JAMM 1380]|uniref:Amidohydrolase n=2 Tax=Neptunomonas TaxID=75687 RepID=A0A7R6PVB3_9GAMM|nr:amidohydrolase [Neptunomonas japonica JAMM 1380]
MTQLMKTRISTYLLGIALLAAIVIALLVGLATPGHRVFINGNIITVDDNNSIVEAISIRDGKIEAIDSNKNIRKLIQKGTQVTDLKGKTLLPGFIDAHSHFPSSGLTAISADLSPPPTGRTSSIALLLDSMRLQAAMTPPGKWLLGFGYDDSSLTEKRHPTRQELDSISSEHPIYLWHSSGHMGIANSLALEKVGITEKTLSPSGGVIGRDANTGKLNGLLQEKSALSLTTLLQDFSFTDYYQIFRQARDDYSKNGITTAQSGGIGVNLTRALYWASQLRQIPFRMVVFPNHQSFGQQLLNGSYKQTDFNSERFYLGPIKIIADGSVQGRTAFLTKPFYKNPPAIPDYRGFPSFEQTELSAIVSTYHDAGFQLAIHGNGDAAIDQIINAFAKAQKYTPSTDPRLILVHAQMARLDQLKSMQALGITPSFFPTHTYYWGDQHIASFMGPKRGAMMSPTGSAAALGLKFSVHTDAPVTPISPLQLLWSTVNRQSVSGNTIGEEQKISTMQAIRSMTIDAAWQVFQEKNRGSIEQGKFADLVLLSGNPLENPKDIKQIKVLETIVDGVTVYTAETKNPKK